MFEKVAKSLLIWLSAIALLLVFFFLFQVIILKETYDSGLEIFLSIILLSMSLLLIRLLRLNLFLSLQLIILTLIIVGFIFYTKLNNSPVTDPDQRLMSYDWLSEEEKFSMPFHVSKSGRIFLEAQVNDTSGLFLFDTGADLSTLNEIISGDSILHNDFTLTDAIGLQQTKKLRVIDHFQLGEIQVRDLVFWPEDSLTHQQDSTDDLLGIIGNNFLTHFVWDFDMRNERVTIAKSVDDLEVVENETTLPLKKMDRKWKIPVMIDDKEREIELDFGFSGTISLRDSTTKEKNAQRGTEYGKKGSLFSHTLSGQAAVDTSFFVVAKSVKLGDQEFTDTKYYEKKYAELIGMQFIWAFERVILDYPNQKVIFSKKDQSHEFAVKAYSLNDYLTVWINMNKGYYVKGGTPYLVHESKLITEEKDTVDGNYYIYGKAKYWGKDVNSLDSIEVLESVKLPNGDSVKAPYIIDVRDEYFVED